MDDALSPASNWSSIDSEVVELSDTKALLMQPDIQSYAFISGQRAIPALPVLSRLVALYVAEETEYGAGRSGSTFQRSIL